ncbi:hypothetical protein LSTR_LSTR001550 [Laodelphax striatellus]|uniref:BTB domain-containing protein n=1 Tax=Laodelphax striatellus TaxID=195883 RepID=A0A482XC71_LAOST|nr:hypothetical protein LSTR_LSTR001550 [Laodelphax striatellus]
MANKSFHLRWNNHLQNLRTLFESIYNEQNLVDVTLSCSDGMLKAHKLVLSACSPYFEAVFRENPCKHPIVILKGIQLQEIKTLLEYMYIGSVDVLEDDLEVLLNVANELQVKGLVQKQQPFTNGNSVPPNERKRKLENERRLKDNGKSEKHWKVETLLSPDGLFYNKKSKNRNDENNQNTEPIEEESQSLNESNSNQMMESDSNQGMPLHPVIKVESPDESEGATCDDVINSNVFHATSNDGEGAGGGEDKQHQQTAQALLEHHEESTFCLVCNKNFHSRQNLRRHLQTHTGEKPHRCDYCDLSFLRLSHLQRHVRVHTGERPYACTLCPKQFSRSDKLKSHMTMQHSGSTTTVDKKPRGRPRIHPMVPTDFSLGVNNENSLFDSAAAGMALNALGLPGRFNDVTISPAAAAAST